VIAEQGDLEEITAVRTKKIKATMLDKQQWYSELLEIAHERQRSEGWAAHAYREKFQVWPNHLMKVRRRASLEVKNWVKHRAIAFAHRKKVQAKSLSETASLSYASGDE
jgi:hypothetical protein